MKTEQFLHKLQAFFDTDSHKKRQHILELKKVLIKLKKKERKIAYTLLQADDCLIKQYQSELAIIRIQRKKGIKALQQLIKSKKS